MADLINPFSGMPNPSDYTVHGVPNLLSIGAANQRQEMAQPFLDMLQQSQGLDLAKKRLEMEEFSGANAVAARDAKRRKEKAEFDEFITTSPYRITQEREKARLSPYLTEQQIADAQLKAMEAKNAPYQAAIQFFGNNFDRLDRMKPAERQAAYEQMLEEFKTTHPEFASKIPQALQAWDSNTMSRLAAHRAYQISTPKFYQEMAKQELVNKSQEKQHQISAGGTVAAAQVAAAARDRATEAQYGKVDEASFARWDNNTRENIRKSIQSMYSMALINAQTPAARAKVMEEMAQKEEEMYENRLKAYRESKPIRGTAPSEASKSEVEAAGFQHEPEKYEYRIFNGRVQRKPRKQGTK